MKAPRGKLTAIVGPVGAGKSSLLAAMLKEMEQLTGQSCMLVSIVIGLFGFLCFCRGQMMKFSSLQLKVYWEDHFLYSLTWYPFSEKLISREVIKIV